MTQSQKDEAIALSKYIDEDEVAPHIPAHYKTTIIEIISINDWVLLSHALDYVWLKTQDLRLAKLELFKALSDGEARAIATEWTMSSSDRRTDELLPKVFWKHPSNIRWVWDRAWSNDLVPTYSDKRVFISVSGVRLRSADLIKKWPIVATNPIAQGKKRGPQERYDYFELERQQQTYVKTNGAFRSPTDHHNWCVENLRLKTGAWPPKGKRKGDNPDPHTVAEGIKRHKLDKMPGVFAED